MKPLQQIEKWKGRKVIVFSWKEFFGFYPKNIGIVLEETGSSVLVRVGFLGKKFVLKNDSNIQASKISGYAELTIQ